MKTYLELCHPRCVCENWKGHVVKQNCVKCFNGCYYVVGPCHHGMARPQVADRGTASDKEDSCE